MLMLIEAACVPISFKSEYDSARQNSIPAAALSPSPNNQHEPAIDGARIVWSENINGYWQIILFDLTDNSRHELTTSPNDHIYPSISGDIVIWWEGEKGGADYVAGVNYAKGQALLLPQIRVVRPKVGNSGLVWTGPTETSLLANPIQYFDLNTGASRDLATGQGHRI